MGSVGHGEGADLLAGAQVPQPERVPLEVSPGCYRLFALGEEGDVCDTRFMPDELLDLPAGPHVVQAEQRRGAGQALLAEVLVAQQQELAVGGEGTAADPRGLGDR